MTALILEVQKKTRHLDVIYDKRNVPIFIKKNILIAVKDTAWPCVEVRNCNLAISDFNKRPCGNFHRYKITFAVGNKLIFLGWPDDNPHPLPAKTWKTCLGVAPIPWMPFIMVMVTHIVPLECVHFDEHNADNVTLKTSVHASENASEQHHYFLLAFRWNVY